MLPIVRVVLTVFRLTWKLLQWLMYRTPAIVPPVAKIQNSSMNRVSSSMICSKNSPRRNYLGQGMRIILTQILGILAWKTILYLSQWIVLLDIKLFFENIIHFYRMNWHGELSTTFHHVVQILINIWQQPL